MLHQCEICDPSTSLEFVLESHGGKDGVIYKDGKLSLTIPKELKTCKEYGKNLFDIINTRFTRPVILTGRAISIQNSYCM